MSAMNETLAPPPVTPRWQRLKKLAGNRPWLGSCVAAVLAWAATVWSANGQGSGDLLAAALAFSAFTVLVSLGQMLVISVGPGNADLSIPSTIALAGAAAMIVMDGNNAMLVPGLLAATAVGAGVGLFNFALIRLLRIPPIIATLAASLIVMSVAINFGRGLKVKPPALFSDLMAQRILGVPLVAMVALVVTVLIALMLERTVLGRSIAAVGQNRRAAQLAGLRVERTRLLAYVICAALAGFTGALIAGFSGGNSLDQGAGIFADDHRGGGDRRHRGGRWAAERARHLGRGDVHVFAGGVAQRRRRRAGAAHAADRRHHHRGHRVGKRLARSAERPHTPRAHLSPKRKTRHPWLPLLKELPFGFLDGTGFEQLDARFKGCIPGPERVVRLWTGARWCEGPAWFGAHRTLVWSDIPNNRMLRYDEVNGTVGMFREPSNNTNGHTVDRQGRLLSCEHLTRRVTRTEHDGSDHRAGLALARQTIEFAERRGGAFGRRRVVHRPELRHPVGLRGPARRERNRRLPRVPRRPRERRCGAHDRRLRQAQRAGVLARRIAAVHRRHGRQPR
jgi:ribose transport system permease protein